MTADDMKVDDPPEVAGTQSESLNTSAPRVHSPIASSSSMPKASKAQLASQVRVATAGLVLDDSGVDNTRTDVLCVDELSSDIDDSEAEDSGSMLNARNIEWWGRGGFEDEDNDPYDVSRMEDPLAAADIYMEEEILQRRKGILEHLRSLYQQELNALTLKLKGKRRRYLNARRECLRIMTDSSEAVAAIRLSFAMEKIHPRYRASTQIGMTYSETLKQHRAAQRDTEKHKSSDLASNKITTAGMRNVMRCVLCDRKILPQTSYCFRHILSDDRQLLFAQCQGITHNGVRCLNVIVKGCKYCDGCISIAQAESKDDMATEKASESAADDMTTAGPEAAKVEGSDEGPGLVDTTTDMDMAGSATGEGTAPTNEDGGASNVGSQSDNDKVPRADNLPREGAAPDASDALASGNAMDDGGGHGTNVGNEADAGEAKASSRPDDTVDMQE